MLVCRNDRSVDLDLVHLALVHAGVSKLPPERTGEQYEPGVHRPYRLQFALRAPFRRKRDIDGFALMRGTLLSGE